jgi:hypothetical protein
MGPVGGGAGTQEILAPWFAYLWLQRRERETSNLKGFKTDFLVEGGRDFIRWSISNIKKNQNEKTGEMGDTVCALKSLSYISEWWNWKGNRRGSISVCFKHTDNFTQVNIHKISLLLQESRELFYIFLKDSKPMFCKIYLFPPVKEQYHKDGASVPPC